MGWWRTISSHTEIIKELQERNSKNINQARRRRDRLVAWYEATRLTTEKEKHQNTFVGLDLLCNVIKDMTLETQLPKAAALVYNEDLEDSD